MARKAIVNRDTILGLLREGKTTQDIAEKFSVSRQAIDLHRRDFISRGLLPDQRATRIRKAGKETVSPEPQPIQSTESAADHRTTSLDEQVDLMINAFDALKRLPIIETELEMYKRKYEDARQEVERLRQIEQKRQEQERRWLQLQGRATPQS